MVREINSRQNQEIKLVADLKLQKERQKQQKFIAEGLRACEALMKYNIFLSDSILDAKIYCTDKMLENAEYLVEKAKISQNNRDLKTSETQKASSREQDSKTKNSSGPEIILVTDTVMEKISSASTPSGILCVLPTPKQPAIDKLSSGIVLAGVSDPGNMGTLVRTCAAMGFKSIVLVDCTDIFSPKVIQSSAGEIGKVNIFNFTWAELLEAKKNLKLIALVACDGQSPNEINFTDSLLVIGSEAHGIPEQWIENCEEKLTLPMPGQTESLNAAIAGSIAMYIASMSVNTK